MVNNWKDPISSVAGCNLKLLVPSLSAFTRDQLTLHFPSGSGIPAATPRRYEPHGMTEIFIKNLPTSVGGRGDVRGVHGVHLITATVGLRMDEDECSFGSETILEA